MIASTEICDCTTWIPIVVQPALDILVEMLDFLRSRGFFEKKMSTTGSCSSPPLRQESPPEPQDGGGVHGFSSSILTVLDDIWILEFMEGFMTHTFRYFDLFDFGSESYCSLASFWGSQPPMDELCLPSWREFGSPEWISTHRLIWSIMKSYDAIMSIGLSVRPNKHVISCVPNWRNWAPVCLFSRPLWT